MFSRPVRAAGPEGIRFASTTVGNMLPQPDSTNTMPSGSPFSFVIVTCREATVYNEALYTYNHLSPLSPWETGSISCWRLQAEAKGVNNLPKVAAQQCRYWDLNPRPSDHKSDALPLGYRTNPNTPPQFYIASRVIGSFTSTLHQYWQPIMGSARELCDQQYISYQTIL